CSLLKNPHRLISQQQRDDVVLAGFVHDHSLQAQDAQQLYGRQLLVVASRLGCALDGPNHVHAARYHTHSNISTTWLVCTTRRALPTSNTKKYAPPIGSTS